MKYALFLWSLCLLSWCWFNIAEMASCYSMSRNFLVCADLMEYRMTEPATSAWQATRQIKR